MFLFTDLKDYTKYFEEYKLNQLLNVDLSAYGELTEKVSRTSLTDTVEHFATGYENGFDAELDDLIRLHFLVISRKVSTILEIGTGKSTIIFDNALEINKKRHYEYYKENVRCSNLFECHTIDDDDDWIRSFISKNKTKNTTFYHSIANVSLFNERICTLFEKFPNICPDLIYIDGPAQFSPQGEIRGIHTRQLDRLPMSADILAIEHFLLPGTLIVLDGRTANARFLQANFQRNWNHYYVEKYDQHFFELAEKPLGLINKDKIDYCLGEDFYKRIKEL